MPIGPGRFSSVCFMILVNSTSLQTWLDLGTVNADTNGDVQFLDTNAPLFNQRFYLTLPQ